ncbi:MAG: ammonia channel protein [Alkalinema sp. CACIAM 70d]|nr:MAG: ammonia channel protein [Alkalinema sp. CACIAM 70d]
MLNQFLRIGLVALGLLAFPLTGNAWADPTPVEAAQKVADTALSNADTAWLLISTALVLLMTPGLAFFYGGFVRSKHVLNTMMMSFIMMGIVGVTWVLWGYSLSFAPGNPFIGGLQWLFLNGVGLETTDYLKGSAPEEVVSYAATVPHQLYMLYQMTFAIITPALISGAIVERISFKAYFWFMVLWAGILYPIFAHMVWAKGGFLGLYGGLGALDFAGGTVVHISSGVSALVAAWVIGPRKTYPNQPAAPHNVPFILLGAGLLFFGWFGFNGGSALASGGLAAAAVTTTAISATAAGLVWVILEWVLRGKPTAVGIATGIVAGLVGITPAAGFCLSPVCLAHRCDHNYLLFFAVSLKAKLQFDDSLDTFPVHGVGGTVGAILTAVFADLAVNSAGKDGVLKGNFGELGVELVAIAVTYALAGIGTFIILKVLDATIGLRTSEETEYQGLDINEHGEEAYGEELAAGLSFTAK